MLQRKKHNFRIQRVQSADVRIRLEAAIILLCCPTAEMGEWDYVFHSCQRYRPLPSQNRELDALEMASQKVGCIAI